MTPFNLCELEEDEAEIKGIVVCWIDCLLSLIGASLVAQMVKNLPANAGDWSSITGLGWSPSEGDGYPPQYSSWRIPRTEKPGRLQSTGLQRVRHDWATNTQTVSKGLPGPSNLSGIRWKGQNGRVWKGFILVVWGKWQVSCVAGHACCLWMFQDTEVPCPLQRYSWGCSPL